MARNNPTPPVFTGNALLVIPNITLAGQQVEMTFGYFTSILTAVPTPAMLQAFGTAWIAALAADMQACQTADSIFFGVTVADLSPGVCPSQFVSTGGTAGTVAGHCYPTTVAAVMRKTSALKGQRARGRYYMPGVPLSFVTPATEIDLLNAGAVTLYNAFGTALVVPLTFNGNAAHFAVLNRVAPPALLPTTAAQVASSVVDPLLGTVRRRREGRGQ